MEDQLTYYQLQAEVALEEGSIEEAKVWAALAQSAATSAKGNGQGPLRGGLSPEYREMMKQQVRNGEWPNLAPTGPPGGGTERPPRPPRPERPEPRNRPRPLDRPDQLQQESPAVPPPPIEVQSVEVQPEEDSES